MGCSASKNLDIKESSSKKLDVKEICLQRRCNSGMATDLSIPLQQHPRLGENIHIVALTSSSYGIMKDDPLKHAGELRSSSMGRIGTHLEPVHQMYEKLKDFEISGGMASHPWSDMSAMLSNLKSEAHQQISNEPPGRRKGPEVINTWELMAGLEDEDSIRGAGAMPGGRARRRSRSVPPSLALDGAVPEPPSDDSGKHSKISSASTEGSTTWSRGISGDKSPSKSKSAASAIVLGDDLSNNKQAFSSPGSSSSGSSSVGSSEHSSLTFPSETSESEVSSAWIASQHKISAPQGLDISSCSLNGSATAADEGCSPWDSEVTSVISQKECVINGAGAFGCDHGRHSGSVSELGPDAKPSYLARSSFKADAFEAEQLASPNDLASPTQESNDPVFDPELIATFEKALEQFSAEKHWPPAMNEPDENVLGSGGSGQARRTLQELGANANIQASEASPICLQSEIPNQPKTPRTTAWMEKQSSVKQASEGLIMEFEQKCPREGEGKVVLYTTSLRGIRKTYEDCKKIRAILEGLGVKVDERDVSMDAGLLKEVKELVMVEHKKDSSSSSSSGGASASSSSASSSSSSMSSSAVPRLFVRGRDIGGAEEVERLHEEGKLVELLRGMPMEVRKKSCCAGCGGVRFIPCPACSGSCKVFDEQGCTLSRCLHCNENGLSKCHLCSSS